MVAPISDFQLIVRVESSVTNEINEEGKLSLKSVVLTYPLSEVEFSRIKIEPTKCISCRTIE